MTGLHTLHSLPSLMPGPQRRPASTASSAEPSAPAAPGPVGRGAPIPRNAGGASPIGKRPCAWLVLAVFLLALAPGAGANDGSAPLPEAVIQAAAKQVEAGDLPAATDALVTLDGQDIPAHLRTRADLLLGIVLFRQGRADEAVSRLEAVASDAVLGGYALYHMAQAQRSAGRRDLAAEALRQLGFGDLSR